MQYRLYDITSKTRDLYTYIISNGIAHLLCQTKLFNIIIATNPIRLVAKIYYHSIQETVP